MNITKQAAVMLLLIILSGCATKSLKNGSLWNYQRDYQNEKTSADYVPLGAGIEAIVGGIIGGTLGSVVAPSMLQNGIQLTPKELAELITKSLLPKPQAILVNTSAQNNSPSPEQLNTNWTIADSNEGQITTDWQSIPGKKVGILWWEKTYETEVRHIITIKQSYGASNLSNFTIATEVRERPNVTYPWAEANSELGRASFEKIKNFLLLMIDAEIKLKRAKK